MGTINHKVKFFNQEFEIRGRLAKTGMGFDNSVFMTIEETHRLAKEYEKIINHPVAKKDDISSILVKVEKNKDPKTIQKLIKEEFKKEKVYPLLPRKIMTQVSDSAKKHACICVYFDSFDLDTSFLYFKSCKYLIS